MDGAVDVPRRIEVRDVAVCDRHAARSRPRGDVEAPAQPRSRAVLDGGARRRNGFRVGGRARRAGGAHGTAARWAEPDAASGGHVVLLRGAFGGANRDDVGDADRNGEDAPPSCPRGVARGVVERRAAGGVMAQATRCMEFERWLDQGADAEFAVAMRAHAARCHRCSEALAAMESIDAWLAEPPAAPSGFSDRVMAQIERVEQARPALPWVPRPIDDLPWWNAILTQPAVVLAALVAALVLWRGETLLRATVAGVSWLAGALPVSLGAWGGLTHAAAAGSRNGLSVLALSALALGAGLTPVLMWASSAIGRLVTRRASIAR